MIRTVDEDIQAKDDMLSEAERSGDLTTLWRILSAFAEKKACCP